MLQQHVSVDLCSQFIQPEKSKQEWIKLICLFNSDLRYLKWLEVRVLIDSGWFTEVCDAHSVRCLLCCSSPVHLSVGTCSSGRCGPDWELTDQQRGVQYSSAPLPVSPSLSNPASMNPNPGLTPTALAPGSSQEAVIQILFTNIRDMCNMFYLLQVVSKVWPALCWLTLGCWLSVEVDRSVFTLQTLWSRC